MSALSVRGVEKKLLAMPGVKRSDVNYVSGSATVEYDETVVDLKRSGAASACPPRDHRLS